MVRAYDRDGIRFATWVGHGRDPEVAYLDATQLVIGSAELAADGWRLFDKGRSYNVLGGEVEGPIDRAVLHRISHSVLDRDGARWFLLDGPGQVCGKTNELCDLALPAPTPGTPYHEPGSFHLEADFCLQWVTWDEPIRAGVLRRAAYVDGSYLMEAGLGRDGTVRVWPARGLGPYGLELVTPSASEAAGIEDRVSRITTANTRAAGRSR
jgi:hypothetical protein